MESQADSIFANTQTIENYDAELWQALNLESERQEEHIELIASENYASKRVMEAQGGLLTNKYAEGYQIKDIMVVANMLILQRNLQLIEQSNSSKQTMQTSNLTQDPLQMLLHF